MFLLFLGFVVFVSGFVAYSADQIARRVGRKHLRLFGLRPKTTAVIVAVGAGMLISFVSVLAFGLANRQALRNIAQADRLRIELRDLKVEFATLQDTVAQTRKALGEARAQVRTLEIRRASAVAERDRVATEAAKLEVARDLAVKQRDRAAAEARALQSRVQSLGVRAADLDRQAADNAAQLAASREALLNIGTQVRGLSTRVDDLQRVRTDLEQRAALAQNAASVARAEAQAAQTEAQAAQTEAQAASARAKQFEARATEAQEQASAARADLERAQAQTREAARRADAARLQARRAAESTAALQVRLGTLGTQIGRLQEQSDRLTRERDSLQRERDSLQRERSTLQRERAGLQKERDALQKERTNLLTDRDRLRTERDRVQAERDEARRDVVAQQNLRERLLQSNQTLRDDLRVAEQQANRASADLTNLVSALRTGNVTYEKGALVHAQVVASVQNLPDALRDAARKAQTRGARGEPAAALPADSLSRLQAKLRGLNTSSLVVLRASTNAVQGYPVELTAEAFPNTLLYRRGQVIRSSAVESGASPERLRAQLLDLVSLVVSDLHESGVPLENIRDNGLSTSEVLTFIDSLARSGTVNVGVAARTDVRPGNVVDLYPTVVK